MGEDNPNDFSQLECETIVKLVTEIRHFAPKRISKKNESGETSTSPPTPNIGTMIRVVLLCNHLLRFTGTRTMLAATPLLHPFPRYIRFPWEQPLSMIFFAGKLRGISICATVVGSRSRLLPPLYITRRPSLGIFLTLRLLTGSAGNTRSSFSIGKYFNFDYPYFWEKKCEN
jgi:hypothetical protein